MEIRQLSAEEPFITRDGSTIRSILDRANAPVEQQSLAEATSVSKRIRAVAKRFLGIEVDSLGAILSDAKVRQSVRQKAPFVIQYPRSAASKCLREIADKIQGEKPPVARSGFFRRLAQILSSMLG